MKKITISGSVLSCFSFVAMSQPMNYVSQTGFTGLLRTPHAHTLEYGSLSIGGNWEDNVDFNQNYSKGAHHTLFMGIGLAPSFELGLQNTHKSFNGNGTYGSGGSDLAFSFKLSSEHWLPDSPLQFALGVQDVGFRGHASFHKNEYLVASYTWNDLRLTAGYGAGHYANQMGENYLDGMFGGIEYQVFPWSQVTADYDGTGYNAGIRFNTPQSLLPDGWRLDALMQLYSNSSTKERDNQYFGFHLKVPLSGTGDRATTVRSTSESYHSEGKALLAVESNQESEEGAEQSNKELNAPEQTSDFKKSLIQSLIEHGFENVQVSQKNQMLSVAVENNVYNKNEKTALVETINIVKGVYQGDFSLYLLNNQLPVLKVIGNKQALEDFDKNSGSLDAFEIDSFDAVVSYYRDHWSSSASNRSMLKPRINLSPYFMSSLGTEYGVFDYSLGLSSNLTMDLWPGAVLDVRYVKGLSASDDPKKYNTPVPEIEDGVDRALIHQAFMLPWGFSTQFSYGRIYKDYLGLMNESQWQSSNGRHKIRTLHGVFEKQAFEYQAAPSLLYYRFAMPEWDWALELHTGQYMYADKGIGLKSMHWFGDTKVSLEFNRTVENYAGLYFEIPLGFSKDMNPDYFQITGIDSWKWGYYTRLSTSSNHIVSHVIVEPELQHSLNRAYFNRDRLSPIHLK